MFLYCIKYIIMQDTDLDWPIAQWTKITPPSFIEFAELEGIYQ